MNSLNLALVLIVLVASGNSVRAQTAPTPEISYDGGELQFSFSTTGGLTLVGLHYSVNTVLNGVEAGQVNVDITGPINNRLIHKHRVAMKSGDFVSYWYVAIVNGQGLQKTGQRWDYQAGPPPVTVPPTTTTRTTRTSTTTAPRTQGTRGTGGPNPATPAPPGPGGEHCTSYPCLIFEDNFDFLDFNKWEHEITAGGGGNWEFQYYHNSRRNSFTRDGKLFIKPTLTADDRGEEFVRSGHLELWGASPANLCTGNQWWGCSRSAGGGRIINPVQSARLRTVNTFAFRYGKVEIEAKMPTGDWIWPAIWMLPQKNEYGEWPASGEIDLVEARGNRNLKGADGVSTGVDQMGMTLHWGPKWPFNGYPKTHVVKNLSGGKTFGTDFHRYQFEWGPDIGLVFSLDDEHLLTINPEEGFWKHGEEFWVDPQTKKPLDEAAWNPWKEEGGASRLAPFDKPYYLIMNVAIGGTGYFGDEMVNSPYPKPWRNNEDNAMGSFYAAKNLWYPTWKDENDETALQVNYVRVWKTEPDSRR